MPRTKMRNNRMTSALSIRTTEGDLARIRLHAQELGIDASAFIRKLLIENKVIMPTGE